MSAWLVDTSALARLGASPDALVWAERIDRGLVRISSDTRLEVGYSARSGPALRAASRRPPLAMMLVEYQTPATEDRAMEVQTLLADRGRHRAPSIPDLIVAATAELADLVVLHVDKDDLIAEVTGQATERLQRRTPQGSSVKGVHDLGARSDSCGVCRVAVLHLHGDLGNDRRGLVVRHQVDLHAGLGGSARVTIQP